MQPPVRRRAQVNISVAHYLIRGGLNLGCLLVALLTLRAAVALVSGDTEGGFTRIITKITQPLIWPIAKIPGFGDHLVGIFTLADLVTPILLGIIFLLVIGTVAGWESEGRRQAHG